MTKLKSLLNNFPTLTHLTEAVGSSGLLLVPATGSMALLKPDGVRYLHRFEISDLKFGIEP